MTYVTTLGVGVAAAVAEGGGRRGGPRRAMVGPK